MICYLKLNHAKIPDLSPMVSVMAGSFRNLKAVGQKQPKSPALAPFPLELWSPLAI